MLASKPRSTAGTGVAYSCGYNFRSASIAAFTRSSSEMEIVLIQVILFFVPWRNVFAKSIGSGGRGYGRPVASRIHRFLGGIRRLLRVGRNRLCGIQWDGNVFVNGLAFVIVFRVILSVRSGGGLRRFIGLVTQITNFVRFRFGVVAETVVAEH